MFFYFEKQFDSVRVGKTIAGIVCEQCRGTYYYELARIGNGTRRAPYWIGTEAAEQKAQEMSQEDLDGRLAMEAELVPCPRCNWISEELVDGYRMGRYRGISYLAFKTGIVGTLLSFAATYFIYVGPERDHWLLPYLWIGGPAFFIGLALTMLGIRKWLRSRIQPNMQFPREPTLPPGTPPALLFDEETKTFRLAKPAAIPADDSLDFQYARQVLPKVCCVCLQPGSVANGYPIKVTKLVTCTLPRCAECARKASRQRWWNWLKAVMWGLPINVVIVSVMIREGLQTEIIIDMALFLLALTMILAASLTASQTAPARVTLRDEARGVVRIRFLNPDFVSVVNQSPDVIRQGD